MKNASQSAACAMVIAFRKLERSADFRALQTYIASSQYQAASATLNAADRLTVAKAQFAAQLACHTKAPLAPKWSMIVRWTPQRIALLQLAFRKHGIDDEGIARELGIPYHNARRARLRYCGKIAPAPGVPATAVQQATPTRALLRPNTLDIPRQRGV